MSYGIQVNCPSGRSVLSSNFHTYLKKSEVVLSSGTQINQSHLGFLQNKQSFTGVCHQNYDGDVYIANQGSGDYRWITNTRLVYLDKGFDSNGLGGYGLQVNDANGNLIYDSGFQVMIPVMTIYLPFSEFDNTYSLPPVSINRKRFISTTSIYFPFAAIPFTSAGCGGGNSPGPALTYFKAVRATFSAGQTSLRLRSHDMGVFQACMAGLGVQVFIFDV